PGGDLLDELGGASWYRRAGIEQSGDFARGLDFVGMAEGFVYRRVVLLDHGFTALAVGLLYGVLDGGDGLFAGQHAADGEETGLHDGVDAAAHARGFGDFVTIDDVEFQLFVDDLLLHLARQFVPDVGGSEGAVEQKSGAGFGALQHIEA